jgi:hypothetical protein
MQPISGKKTQRTINVDASRTIQDTKTVALNAQSAAKLVILTNA